MRSLITALLLLAALPAVAQNNEKLFSTDLNVRTILSFKVPDTVVQKLLPSGFDVNSPTAGPSKGFNLAVVLIDRLMVQDPEGKPLPSDPVVAMAIPAKKSALGEAVAVVFLGFTAQAGVPGAYSVYDSAKVTVERRSATDASGKSIIDETWLVKADDGSALKIELQFARGVPVRGKAEAKVHSAAKPDFYRIYQIEQAADVARSTSTGVDRVTKFSFEALGPKLAPLFEGSQELVSITSVPFYSRSIYLPHM